MTKYAKKGEVENLKVTIRRLLVAQKKYSDEMTYAVELLASDLCIFRKIREKALEEGTKVQITETSREGHDRYGVNPIFDQLARYSDRVRKDLRVLTMTKEIKDEAESESEVNPLAELIKGLKDEEEEEDE